MVVPKDLQSSLYEENQLRIKLQMEVDSKDSEVEQLTQKLASASADTVSNISSGAENDSEEGVQVTIPSVVGLFRMVFAVLQPSSSSVSSCCSIFDDSLVISSVISETKQ